MLKLNKHKSTKKDDIYVRVPLWTYWRYCRGVGSADVSYMPMFTRIEVTMSKDVERVKLILAEREGEVSKIVPVLLNSREMV